MILEMLLARPPDRGNWRNNLALMLYGLNAFVPRCTDENLG